MPGNKTHEKQVQTFERQDDYHRPEHQETAAGGQDVKHPEARDSEFPVSRGGMNQESRQHNKHNNPPAGAQKS